MKNDIEQLKRYAVHAIISRGVLGEGQCSTQPPMVNTEEMNKNKDYLAKLLRIKGGYVKYVSSIEGLNTIKINSKISKQSHHNTVVITVNKDLQGNDLINQGIIPKLNSGF